MDNLWFPRLSENRFRLWLAGPSTVTAVHYSEAPSHKMFLCRRFINEPCPACELAREEKWLARRSAWGSSPSPFKAFPRWAWPVIDLEVGASTIQLYLAGAMVNEELVRLFFETKSVAVYRSGQGLQTHYTLYSYRLPTVATRAYGALCRVLPVPQLDYGSPKEMALAYPPSILSELQRLDATLPLIEVDRDRYCASIPFDQGQNTPERKDSRLSHLQHVAFRSELNWLPKSEPREYCWNCGADTTDDFPFGPCRGCELKEEAEPRCT